jgi:hypothetical protein
MKRMVLTLLSLLLIPAFTFAQPTQDSWDNLQRLEPGQKVEIVDVKMKTYNGRFVSFTDEAITVHEGKREVTVQRADVVRVSVRDNSHRTRNMLLGAGIGGAIAIAATIVPLVANSNEGNGCGICAAGIAAGFGGGTALGMIPSHRTIYRAQAPKQSAAN